MTPEQRATLELISTADLYDEFKNRFEHCMVAGLSRRPTEDDPDHYLVSYTYSGAPMFCLGLAVLVSNKCQKDIESGLDPRSTDEL